MFFTTANTLNILPPLLDRMEVIRIPGYTEDEKINIANKFLLPKTIKENGVKTGEMDLSDGTIKEVIGNYEYGAQLAEQAFGRGCLGCHSIDKFKGSSADEILDRLVVSWHASGYTDEDLRDITVYLAKEVESQ